MRENDEGAIASFTPLYTAASLRNVSGGLNKRKLEEIVISRIVTEPSECGNNLSTCVGPMIRNM